MSINDMVKLAMSPLQSIPIEKGCKNILFITEKYCERHKPKDKSNLTNSFHNIFETCKDFGKFNAEHLWLDEQPHINDQIINYFNGRTKEELPDYIIYSFYGCDYNINPHPNLITDIHQIDACKQILLWWDAAHPCIKDQIRALAPYVDLQINMDATDLSNIASNTFFCGVPQAKRLFHYDSEKEYDITFLGRTDGYTEREQYLRYLVHNNFPINIGGGRTEENLSPEAYAKIICKSHININFCNTPHGWPQCKGRVWEILSSQTMLLEQENNVISQHLTPYKEYIPFTSPQDLLDKAKYYIAHPDERDIIIKNATLKFKEKFDYLTLWNKIYNL